jgi:hypothetical protein
MATAGLPPLPGSAPEAAPAETQGAMGMGDLLAPGQAPTPAMSPDVQERAQAAMRRIHDLMMAVEALARQFPPAAKPLRAALDGFQDALVAIVSDINRTQQAPPTPRTAA